MTTTPTAVESSSASTTPSLSVRAAALTAGSVGRRFLRTTATVARTARPLEYVVVDVGSGTFYCTDALGASAIRAMINGRSDVDAIDLVERIELGSGERARILIERLGSKGALTDKPQEASGRSWLHRQAAHGVGLFLSAAVPLVRVVPLGVLAWLLMRMPSTPTSRRLWRSFRQDPHIIGTPAPRRPNPQRNYLFLYLSTLLPAGRLDRLVDSLFARDSIDQVSTRLSQSGPVIGVFLHSPLCVAVPNALRSRGHQVVRVVIPCAHGINVSHASGPLHDFFGESPETAVELSPAHGAITGTAGHLLRHLKAGHNVFVALDVPDRKPTAEIPMLGRNFPRNDWPAWLAVRSGRPLAMWTTYASPSGVVLNTSPLIHPDSSLPVEARVANLSEQLYACAERAILQHPEAWTFMRHLALFELRDA